MTSEQAVQLKPLRAAQTTSLQLRAFLSMALLYLFCYFGRYNLSVATPGIKAEFALSNTQFGWITTLFTVVYAAGQFVNGFLADRYGPKRLMIVGGLGCVVANALFGLSGAYVFLCIFWSLNALFSSMLWAPCCRILYHWFPPNRWGGWKGLLGALCYFGGGLVLVIAAPTVDAFGWRAAFFIPPAFLFVMTLLFWAVGKGRPQDAGLQPDWEHESATPSTERAGWPQYVAALTNLKMNLAYLSGAGEKFVRFGLITWLILALKEPVDKGGFGLSLTAASLISSLAFWGAVMFSLVLGVVTDRLFGGKRWQTILISFFISAAGLLFIAEGASILRYSVFGYALGIVPLAIAVFLAGGLVQAIETPLFLLPGQVLGKEMGATGAGIMNGWMYVGALFAGVFLGWWLDTYGMASGFRLMAGVCLCSGLVAIAIRE